MAQARPSGCRARDPPVAETAQPATPRPDHRREHAPDGSDRASASPALPPALSESSLKVWPSDCLRDSSVARPSSARTAYGSPGLDDAAGGGGSAGCSLGCPPLSTFPSCAQGAVGVALLFAPEAAPVIARVSAAAVGEIPSGTRSAPADGQIPRRPSGAADRPRLG